MKQGLVPELRFPEFEDAEGWELKEIGDIFDVTRGYVLSMGLVSEESTETATYPVYSSQTRKNGLAGYYSEYLYENALTWTTDGANAGDVNYREGKFYCTNVCGVLLNNKGYANPCIASILNSITHKHVSYVGNPKLMNGVMSKIVIPFPILEEQQKIADCLSSLDELITAHTQKHQALQSYKKGLLQNLFPAEGETLPALRFPEFEDAGEWKQIELGEIANFYKGKGLPKSEVIEDGKNFCIHYGQLFTEYSEIITEVKNRTNMGGGFLSMENDVLMPTSDVTPSGLAKACCVKSDGVILGGDILVIRTDMSKINGEFLSRHIRSKEQKVLQLVTGSTVYHLYASAIEKLEISIPSIDEQQKIADCLSSVDDLITAQAEKVEELKTHKKGLMQQLFPAMDEVSA